MKSAGGALAAPAMMSGPDVKTMKVRSRGSGPYARSGRCGEPEARALNIVTSHPIAGGRPTKKSPALEVARGSFRGGHPLRRVQLSDHGSPLAIQKNVASNLSTGTGNFSAADASMSAQPRPPGSLAARGRLRDDRVSLK